MKKYFILLISFCIACNNHQKEDIFTPQLGALLFQDLDSSPLCDAIELVTPGYKKGSFSHIGIVIELKDPYCINPNYIFEDHIRILEAIPNKVQTTRLDSFLNRSFDYNNNPKVIVGRLKPKYRHTIQNAIDFLKHSKKLLQGMGHFQLLQLFEVAKSCFHRGLFRFNFVFHLLQLPSLHRFL